MEKFTNDKKSFIDIFNNGLSVIGIPVGAPTTMPFFIFKPAIEKIIHQPKFVTSSPLLILWLTRNSRRVNI
jgi:hypothetical protein